MLRKIMNISSMSLMAFCVFISLSSGIQGMDRPDEDQTTYHPRTSKSGILKTAMVGLGLMLSPTPADALSEFGGCYLMKSDIRYGGSNGIPRDVFTVSEIRQSGCAAQTFEPYSIQGSMGQGLSRKISMSLTVDNYIITIINFCSRIFSVKYTNIIDNGFNMTGNNCYFPTKCTDSFLITVDKSDRNRGKDNIVFDNTFAKFMNTGICPVSTS